MPKEAFYFLIPNNCAITPITCFNYTLVVQIIQKRVGHASINITLDIYGHIFKHGKDKEISALEYWEAKTLRG